MDSETTPRFSPQAVAGIALAAAVAATFLYAGVRYLPLGVDWDWTYQHIPEHFFEPYMNSHFTNPPWAMLLLPHAWLPVAWSNTINLALNVLLILLVVRKFGGDRVTLLITFFSFPFIDLMRTNNIDWIPLLGLLTPNAWGVPLLAVKPHSLGAIVVVWWKKHGFSWRFWLPLAGTLGLSFLVWGWWPSEIGLLDESRFWNFAPWPVGIPVGLYLLYLGYTRDDEMLAAAATPFLTPYIAPYSFTAVLAYVGSKHKKEAFFLSFFFLFYFVVQLRRL
jgi:hypothetical protein